MIDGTFGTPINQHPAEYGIDLVMHSGTKYLGGHSDLICGVVAGRRELMRKNLGDADDAGQLHGSACFVDAGARIENVVGAGGAAERKRAARGGIPGASCEGAQRALSVFEEPSAIRAGARADERRRRNGYALRSKARVKTRAA